MSKVSEKAVETAENQGVATMESNQVVKVENSLNFDELDSMQEGQAMNFGYLDLKEGESVRGFFGGIVTQADKETGEEYEAGAIYTKEGFLLSRSIMVVQASRMFKEGEPMQITFNGMRQLDAKRKIGDYNVIKLVRSN